MPRIRIEWVPVQQFGLGRLGFDHLLLVFQPDEHDEASQQDDWFVMEGVREATRDGSYLGIEGADGRTTLAVANLASRGELAAKIGTPEYRGSRPLPTWANALPSASSRLAKPALVLLNTAFALAAVSFTATPTTATPR